MAFETEKLVIMNGALLRLGAKPMVTFGQAEDGGALCRQFIDPVRQEALRAHPWNFALVRDSLNSFPQATLTPGAITGTGVTFTASAPVFTADDVRSLLAGNNGKARIRTFTDTTHVIADIEANFLDTNPIAIESWRIAPAWRWDFRFPKPTNYLRVVDVEGINQIPGSTPPFVWNWWRARDSSPEPVAAEGKFLVTDVGAKMNILYIQDVEDPTLWDSNCRNAVEALLAFRICYGVTGSLQAAKTQWDSYQAALREARTADGQEDTPHDAGSDVLVAVRW